MTDAMRARILLNLRAAWESAYFSENRDGQAMAHVLNRVRAHVARSQA